MKARSSRANGLRMQEGQAPWAQEHRTVLVGLLVVTAAMFVLGAAQIVRTIRAPFGAPTGLYKTADQLRAEQLAAQKQRDTDEDGLSDYDELTIYLTSPYIADTDSDGVADGTEVAAGGDPNCPQGQQCGPGASAVGPRGSQPADLLATPGSQPTALTLPGSDFVGLTPDLIENMEPEQLRVLLRGAGVGDDILSNFTDEQLMQLFRQTLEKNNPLEAVSSTPR